MNSNYVRKSIKVVPLLLLVMMLGGINSFAAGDSAKGKESFNTTCAMCHGETGKGDGVASASLDPKPRDLSSGEYVSTLTDEHIFKVIKEGGASVGKSYLMPAWGAVLSDDKIWDVIAHLRTDICKCQHKAK
jgi:mono/diheme cytochrome c family protein